MSLYFGEFELDWEQRQLLRSGEPVPLEPKAYELLCLLVERRPGALSRAQIRDVVWPDTHISESTLGVVVNGLRQALGDDAQEPRFIRTVRGFGYAFCGEAQEPDAATGQRVSELRADVESAREGRSVEEAPAVGRRWRVWWGATLLLGTAIVLRFAYSRPTSPPPAPIRVVPLTTYDGIVDAPTFSPDGSQFAFLWDGGTGDGTDIYVRQVDSGGDPVRLTSSLEAEYSPA